MYTLQFTIRRDPENVKPDGVEYWVYEEVEGAEQRGNYIVVKMQNRSAIIPMGWVVEVNELKGD